MSLSRRDVVRGLVGAALVGAGAATYELSGVTSPRPVPAPLGMSGRPWVLKFSEEFVGSRLDANVWSGDGAGVVGDGRLVLTERGSVTTEDSYRFHTGAVEVRAQLPLPASGSTGRFWMRPARRSEPISPVAVQMPRESSAFRGGATGFHVYGAELKSGNVSWYLDGQPTSSYRLSAFDRIQPGPWDLVLTLDVEDELHISPFVIDYVRAWQ